MLPTNDKREHLGQGRIISFLSVPGKFVCIGENILSLYKSFNSLHEIFLSMHIQDRNTTAGRSQ